MNGGASHPSNRVTLDNVRDVMTYHTPHGDQPERYQRIAAAAEVFARTILNTSPDCADRTVALQLVREARMWANSAIALEPLGDDAR